MRVMVTTEDLIMLAAFQRMRQIVKSDAKKKHKEIAINEVFWKANEVLDVAEGGKDND